MEDLGIVDALAQLSFLIQRMLTRHAAAEGLSMTQTRMLGALRDRQPTMAELAALLDLDKSSTTGLVDRAERRGLVARSRSATDGRAIHVTLTPAGRDLADRVAGAFGSELNGALQVLSPARQATLSRLATVVVLGGPGQIRES